MNKNKEALDELMNSIKYLIDNSKDNGTLILNGIIKSANADKTYNVKINGIIYENISSILIPLAVENVVKVIIPQGQYSQMIIIGKINTNTGNTGNTENRTDLLPALNSATDATTNGVFTINPSSEYNIARALWMAFRKIESTFATTGAFWLPVVSEPSPSFEINLKSEKKVNVLYFVESNHVNVTKIEIKNNNNSDWLDITSSTELNEGESSAGNYMKEFTFDYDVTSIKVTFAGNAGITDIRIYRIEKNSATLVTTDTILDFIYPIGSIYMSVNNVSPRSFIGGTWAQIDDAFLLATGTTCYIWKRTK